MIYNYQKIKIISGKKTIYNKKNPLDYLIKKKESHFRFFFFLYMINCANNPYLFNSLFRFTIHFDIIYASYVHFKCKLRFFFIRINNYIKQFNSFIHWSISNYFLSDKTYSIFNLIKIYFLVLEFSLIRFNKRILKDKLLFIFINYILSYRFNHGNYLD